MEAEPIDAIGDLGPVCLGAGGSQFIPQGPSSRRCCRCVRWYHWNRQNQTAQVEWVGPGISPRPPLGCPHHSPRTRLQIKQFVTARQGYLLLSLQWAGAGSPGAMSNSTDGETRSLSPPRIARALMPQAPLAGSRFWRFEIDVGGDVDARTVEGDLEATAIFAGHIPLL
jgi:hypothetical protein